MGKGKKVPDKAILAKYKRCLAASKGPGHMKDIIWVRSEIDKIEQIYDVSSIYSFGGGEKERAVLPAIETVATTPPSLIEKSTETIMVAPERLVDSPPPVFVELMLRFICSAKNQEAIIGDLVENYPKVVARHGIRAAKAWYWSQAIRTALIQIGPSVSRWVLTDILLRKIGF